MTGNRGGAGPPITPQGIAGGKGKAKKTGELMRLAFYAIGKDE